jgi:hypothetical protein
VALQDLPGVFDKILKAQMRGRRSEARGLSGSRSEVKPQQREEEMAERYAAFYRRSIEQPDQFWPSSAADPLAAAVSACARRQPPVVRALVRRRAHQPLLQRGGSPSCPSGRTSPRLVWISTEVDQQKTYTFAELHAEVNRFAAVLQSLGVGQGDRVLIYMPMTPEAVFAMWRRCASGRFIPWCSVASRLRVLPPASTTHGQK